jgi:hypothetical protein
MVAKFVPIPSPIPIVQFVVLVLLLAVLIGWLILRRK